MATDPQATPEKTTPEKPAAPAGVSAADIKKAVEGEGVAKDDVIALVSKDADGKARVTHYSGEEWKAHVAKVTKGEEQVPQGTQLVKLKDGKAISEPAALTQADVVAASQIATAKQSAAAAFEALPDSANGKVAVVVVDKDGKAVGDPKVFQTQEELAAFIKGDGKGLAVGEGQRMMMARVGQDGKVNPEQVVAQAQTGDAGFKAHMDNLEKQQTAAQSEEAKKDNKNWMENFMEKAMESGNMMMMALAALVMWASNRDGRGEGTGAELGAGAGAPAPGEARPAEYAGGRSAERPAGKIEVQKVDTSPGGKEEIKVTGDVTPQQVAAQFGLADKPDVVKQIADSMKANGGMVVLDIEGAGGSYPPPTPVAQAEAGREGGRG